MDNSYNRSFSSASSKVFWNVFLPRLIKLTFLSSCRRIGSLPKRIPCYLLGIKLDSCRESLFHHSILWWMPPLFPWSQRSLILERYWVNLFLSWNRSITMIEPSPNWTESQSGSRSGKQSNLPIFYNATPSEMWRTFEIWFEALCSHAGKIQMNNIWNISRSGRLCKLYCWPCAAKANCTRTMSFILPCFIQSIFMVDRVCEHVICCQSVTFCRQLLDYWPRARPRPTMFGRILPLIPRLMVDAKWRSSAAPRISTFRAPRTCFWVQCRSVRSRFWRVTAIAKLWKRNENKRRKIALWMTITRAKHEIIRCGQIFWLYNSNLIPMNSICCGRTYITVITSILHTMTCSKLFHLCVYNFLICTIHTIQWKRYPMLCNPRTFIFVTTHTTCQCDSYNGQFVQ